ncbi:hypothetical protein A2U01_0118149, partial [Trifolium medium]|nr:hypothetical protein [Trifolium medium]
MLAKIFLLWVLVASTAFLVSLVPAAAWGIQVLTNSRSFLLVRLRLYLI